MKRRRGLFVTATDTEVGKTVVTAGLAALFQSCGQRVQVVKPVQSGHSAEDPEGDAMRLKQWARLAEPVNRIVFRAFQQPVSPWMAARMEGETFDAKKLAEEIGEIPEDRIVLVEGAGGLMTPLGEGFTIADFARLIGFPLLIVARPNLGTVNHTVLTAMAARRYGLELAGVVLNGYRPDEEDPSLQHNPELIRSFGGVDILGRLPWIREISADTLQKTMEEHIDRRRLLEAVGAEIG
ncbi:dethiobiotin synthase [Paludifilum halophilum]|uniref:ATP-dependent dethiobiotin synthetase BioD n=1 Tax=Paludifilum halophilum TaxID=1642702 RepID=A0A235B4M2_9BACL|nr:dethiobiotin synthase [Paludifilum halophilum]OYD06909.1 dethiobiotin synthase [Paludifilum halophilum]